MLIVFVGSSALSTIRLSWAQWGISLILGAISLPIAVLIRLIPDDFIARFIPSASDQSSTPPSEWNNSLKNIREQLTFFRKIRGGRLQALMFKLQRPRELLLSSNRDSIPRTPNNQANGDAEPPHHSWTRSRSNSALGSAAAMAGVIAGSIAGWSPLERGTTRDDDSIRFSSSRRTSNIEN